MWRNPPCICHASISVTAACKVFLIIHPWALPAETQLSSATEGYVVQRQESMRGGALMDFMLTKKTNFTGT